MLDVRTLFLVMILVSLVLAFSLWVGVGRQRQSGLTTWIASLLLQAVAFGLFSLRGTLGDWWTVILANGLFLLCLSLKADAVMQFYGRRMNLAWHVLPPLALMVVFALLLDRIEARVLIGSALYAAVQFGLAVMAARMRTHASENATRLLIIGYGLGAVSFLARALIALVAPEEVNSLLGPSMIQAMTFLFAIVAILMGSVGFMLLFKEQAEDTAQREAATDPLTGIFNRRMLHELGAKEIARSRRSHVPLSILMLDLDHFKKVNDKYGHAAGDEVLRRFVDVTNICLRREDILVRYGGEEFCVLLPEVSDVHAEAMAERIRYAIAHATFKYRDQTIPVTVSVGIASLRTDAEESLEALLQRADEALYAAKNAGRNRVVVCPENSTLAMLMRTRSG